MNDLLPTSRWKPEALNIRERISEVRTDVRKRGHQEESWKLQKRACGGTLGRNSMGESDALAGSCLNEGIRSVCSHQVNSLVLRVKLSVNEDAVGLQTA